MAAIIFDFDGTISDSRDYFVEFLAKQANAYPLTKEVEDSLEGLPLMAIAKAFGFPWWKMPSIYFKGRRQMDIVMKDLKPFKGMPDVIKKLHNEGHQLFIVSSNSVKNIRVFLHHNGLNTYFLEIYGGVELFGKAAMFHRLLRENKLKVSESISVGDEVRDVEASSSIGMRVIAVNWGLSRESDLKKAGANTIVSTPNELIKKLEVI